MYRVLYTSLIAVVIFKVQAETCVTPNKEEANCISLFSCPILLMALGSMKQESIDFYRNSTCGGTPDNPKVCCGSSSSFQVANSTKSAVDLLPNRRICGLQHSDDYHHENDIVLSEAPWLAILKVRYYKPQSQNGSDNVQERGYGCGGTLISARYVLSSISCIASNRYELLGVLLGEFNIDNTTDCMSYKQIQECSEDVTFYGIEKTIRHPAFKWSSYRTKGNDIGLIRLNKTVTYTDYIRPICLPLPGIKRAQIGDTLTFLVWDFLRRLSLVEFSPSKSKITFSLESRDYLTCPFVIPKPEEKICVRRDVNQTLGPCSLANDGNPVVFSSKNQWHIEALNGIQARGGCVEEDSIMIFVNVSYHLDWILNNLEP